jgi:hypothetical protein
MSAFPLTIRQSRLQYLTLGVVAMLFVAGGFWMTGLADTWHRIWGYVCLVFFGLGFLVFLATMIRPGTLVIDSDGVTQTVLFRRHLFRWEDVARFRAWTMPQVMLPARPLTLVAFDDLRPAGRPVLRAINKQLGADAALAPGWTMRPDALAELLNSARRHFVETVG